MREESNTPVKEIPVNKTEKTVICIDGQKFIDSGGGFLLQQKSNEEKLLEEKMLRDAEVSFDDDHPTCLECKKEFLVSYLQKSFDYPVCDACRDSKGKHCLITKTEAKAEYLLKDCDLDKREPPLKYILKKNPHNIRWGQMRLYLLLQVEERALEVWGSTEKLEEAHQTRTEKRVKQKTKQYNRKLKTLRMAVRSSLYDHTSGPSHQHEFGGEKYNEEDDNYIKTCTTCGFTETFEKL